MRRVLQLSELSKALLMRALGLERGSLVSLEDILGIRLRRVAPITRLPVKIDQPIFYGSLAMRDHVREGLAGHRIA